MIGTIGVVLVITLLLLLQIGRAAIARAEPLRPLPEVEPIQTANVTDVPTRGELATLTRDLLDADGTLRSLRRRIDQRRSEHHAAVIDAMRDGDALLAEHLLADQAQLRTEIESLRNRRLVYLIADRASRPIVAELASGRCVLSTDQQADPPIAIRSADPNVLIDRLLGWFQSQANPHAQHLLIVLKPSGLPAWRALQQRIAVDPALADMAIGIDLIPESASTTSFPAEHAP